MREYKFRGKTIDGKEWVYGGLYILKERAFIICGAEITFADEEVRAGENVELDYVEVDPDTVGQYTELKDKHGNKIYEGDIFHIGDVNIKHVVLWNDTGLQGKQHKASSYVGLSHWRDRIVVIGNVHDNPELLAERGAKR